MWILDVAKGDGGGSSQWWVDTGYTVYSLQYKPRGLGNMVFILKGLGK